MSVLVHCPAGHMKDFPVNTKWQVRTLHWRLFRWGKKHEFCKEV